MILVAKITDEQREKLIDTEQSINLKFNPIKDNDNNWIITQEEIFNSDIDWLKNLPLIEYVPLQLDIDEDDDFIIMDQLD
jgi:predicted protein tyrosine phosphatase